MMHDWATTGGHGLILGLLAWIGRKLHKIHFDLRIWKNGNHK